MNIERYVTGVRQKLNDSVVGIPYVGGFLTKDIDVKSMSRVGLVSVVLAVPFVGGCASVVGGYVGHKLAERGDGGKVVEKKHIFVKPLPAIVMEKWQDYNGDKVDSPNEISEDIGNSVNMSDVGVRIHIGHYWSSRPLVTFYTILDSDGRVVGRKNYFKQSLGLSRGALSPGKYTVVVKQGNINLSRDFIVTQ